MVSLYADPRKIVDADEVVEKLAVMVRNLEWFDRDKRVQFRIPIFARICDDPACAQVSHLRFPLPTGFG